MSDLLKKLTEFGTKGVPPTTQQANIGLQQARNAPMVNPSALPPAPITGPSPTTNPPDPLAGFKARGGMKRLQDEINSAAASSPQGSAYTPQNLLEGWNKYQNELKELARMKKIDPSTVNQFNYVQLLRDAQAPQASTGALQTVEPAPVTTQGTTPVQTALTQGLNQKKAPFLPQKASTSTAPNLEDILAKISGFYNQPGRKAGIGDLMEVIGGGLKAYGGNEYTPSIAKDRETERQLKALGASEQANLVKDTYINEIMQRYGLDRDSAKAALELMNQQAMADKNLENELEFLGPKTEAEKSIIDAQVMANKNLQLGNPFAAGQTFAGGK